MARTLLLVLFCFRCILGEGPPIPVLINEPPAPPHKGQHPHPHGPPPPHGPPSPHGLPPPPGIPELYAPEGEPRIPELINEKPGPHWPRHTVGMGPINPTEVNFAGRSQKGGWEHSRFEVGQGDSVQVPFANFLGKEKDKNAVLKRGHKQDELSENDGAAQKKGSAGAAFWPKEDVAIGRASSHQCSACVNMNNKESQIEQQVKTEESIDDTIQIITTIMPSILRIHVVTAQPHFSRPWTVHNEVKSTGSGFPISNRRIVTNAHVTNYARTIEIEKPGTAKRFEVRVLATAPEADLCILTVDSEEFWESTVPLALAPRSNPVPALLSGVFVLGYPTGGNSLSVTEGIVSRVEVGYYAFSSTYLLEIQIDAAINPGNSGGPVIDKEGKVVGVAFQGLQNADSIGYIIPVPVLEHVLEDVELNGDYGGMVGLGASMQALQNVMLEEYVGLSGLVEKIDSGEVSLEEGFSGVVDDRGVLTEHEGEKPLKLDDSSRRLEKKIEGKRRTDKKGNRAADRSLAVDSVPHPDHPHLTNLAFMPDMHHTPEQSDAEQFIPALNPDHTPMLINAAQQIPTEPQPVLISAVPELAGDAQQISETIGNVGNAEENIENGKEGNIENTKETIENSNVENSNTKSTKKTIFDSGVLITGVDEQRIKLFLENNPSLDEGKIGLRRGDVLLALSDRSVASDGSVYFRAKERVELSYLLIGRYANELISAVVLRDTPEGKKVLTLSLPLAVTQYVVPPHSKGEKPRYVIFGGALFVPLSKQYVRDTADEKLGLTAMVKQYQSKFGCEEVREIVILSRVFASKYTANYNVRNEKVEAINGEKVKDLQHLFELLQKSEESKPFTSVSIAGTSTFVIKNQVHDLVTPLILKNNKINREFIL